MIEESVPVASPLISVIVPMYNVAEYLPDFLSAADHQTVDPTEVEWVFVDDGSPDLSAEIVRKWAEKQDLLVKIVKKQNGGLSSARNSGLENATATWVTFVDPDDVLSENYFKDASERLRAHPDVALAVGRLVFWDDSTGVESTHPLDRRFSGGTKIVNIDHSPEHIHLSAATGFYRLKSIQENGLIFDPSIKPNFEDAIFTQKYLSYIKTREIIFLAECKYFYRRRNDQSSLTQTSWSKAEKYTLLLEKGHLELLKWAHEYFKGYIPTWIKLCIIYDMAFYFRADEAPQNPTAWISKDTAARFHEIAREIFSFIEPHLILSFKITRLSRDAKTFITNFYQAQLGHPQGLVIDALDKAENLMRVKYYVNTSSTHKPEFFNGDNRITPVYTKIRSISYLKQEGLHELIYWIPVEGNIHARIEGSIQPINLGYFRDLKLSHSPQEVWKKYAGSDLPLGVSSRVQPIILDDKSTEPKPKQRGRRRRLKRFIDRDWQVQRYAKLRAVRTKFQNAWLLIDRDDQAHDNAEHLYRYLHNNRPDINAWFVLREDSSDWPRLKDEGFRLVPYGSMDHHALLINSPVTISSQADYYITHPFAGTKIPNPKRKFVFLQHGVSKDDISRWLNHKQIDLFITSSTDEHRSLVEDFTPYVYTSHEVKRTGMPRHDALLNKSADIKTKDLLLITPTWRRYLLGDVIAGGNQRETLDGFWTSEYITEWYGLLESRELQALCIEHDLKIAFLPHPNMQKVINEGPKPEGVEFLNYDDYDVQEVIARSALTVTDYSSMAFEAAYVESPVVYFHFDATEFFSGGHAYMKGSWSYEENGFGPICVSQEEVVTSIKRLLNDKSSSRFASFWDYRAYIESVFPDRDGRACERVTAEISRLLSTAS